MFGNCLVKRWGWDWAWDWDDFPGFGSWLLEWPSLNKLSDVVEKVRVPRLEYPYCTST